MVPVNNYFFLMSFKRASGIYINDYFFASSYLKVSIRILELDSSEERKSTRSPLSNACLQASLLEWNTIIILTMCPHFFRIARMERL